MFRFTIRDVLWLTALVALGVGWWQNNRQHKLAAVEAKARFDALDAEQKQTQLKLDSLTTLAKSFGIDADVKPDGNFAITLTKPGTLNINPNAARNPAKK
jgi:hypothetical protein